MLCVMVLSPTGRYGRVTTAVRTLNHTPYRLIAVSPQKDGGIAWDKVRRHVGDDTLVLPRGVVPPSRYGLRVFTGTALRRIWMLAAAETLLAPTPPAKRTVALYDANARYPSVALALAPQVGELLIVTDRRGGFDTVSRTLMHRYGAAISFVAPDTAKHALIGVAPAGLTVNLPRPTVTLSGAPCDLSGVFDGYLPPPAFCVEDATPSLYDALYQVAYRRELAACVPVAAVSGTKLLSIAAAGLDIARSV